MWIATRFTPSCWDYWPRWTRSCPVSSHQRTACGTSSSHRPIMTDKPDMNQLGFYLSCSFEVPFVSPQHFACSLSVSASSCSPCGRSAWGAKGLRPIKCGSRWQPGGMPGRRDEISSVLEDLRSPQWDHSQNRCCCTIWLRETLSKFKLAAEESFRYQNPLGRLGVAYMKGARSIKWADESYSWIYVWWHLVH